jgi:uncharacterized FlaG/YvyC family protein
MADNTVPSIGPADSEARATIIYQMIQDRLFKSPETAPVPALEKIKKAAPRSEKNDENPEISMQPISSGYDTFLKFVVDDKNNDVTVYVVDRATHRIKRSIPPNEVNNLKAGDLLKLLA